LLFGFYYQSIFTISRTDRLFSSVNSKKYTPFAKLGNTKSVFDSFVFVAKTTSPKAFIRRIFNGNPVFSCVSIVILFENGLGYIFASNTEGGSFMGVVVLKRQTFVS
jgi:hypothetical protein